MTAKESLLPCQNLPERPWLDYSRPGYKCLVSITPLYVQSLLSIYIYIYRRLRSFDIATCNHMQPASREPIDMVSLMTYLRIGGKVPGSPVAENLTAGIVGI